MNPQDTRSILTIALMAAFADGLKDERERAAVKRVADSLGADAGARSARASTRRCWFRNPTSPQVAAPLQTPETRQLAYEMAVGVCEADGARGPAESDFLGAPRRRRSALPASVTPTSTQRRRTADAAAAATTAPVVRDRRSARPALSDAEMDELILKASITNAALELLPESIASMAIIPLQLRLVYRIGRSYGYEMDVANAKDFLATVGVGLTGQYLEQFGRKLLGGLLGGIGGGIGRTIGRQAASSGMSFATTYAIGRVAQRYYAAGRTMDAATLKQTFLAMLEEAKGLAPRYQDQIEQMSGRIDTRSLASLIKSA